MLEIIILFASPQVASFLLDEIELTLSGFDEKWRKKMKHRSGVIF
jgi:hypothetical protein